MADKFELRFEGPADDSAPTLRRIKGVFVADLDFPAQDVQRFLEQAPLVIKSADSEGELKDSYNLLTKAGAKVLIVKVSDTQESFTPAAVEFELQPLNLEFDSVIDESSKGIVPTVADQPEPLELSFDFQDAPSTSETPNSEQPKTDSPTSTSDALFFDLSIAEPNDAVPQPQNNSSKDHASDTLDSAPQAQLADSGLSLEIEEDSKHSQTELKPGIEKIDPSKISDQSSGPELEVFTPATSTLFASTDKKAEEIITPSDKEQIEPAIEEPKKQPDEPDCTATPPLESNDGKKPRVEEQEAQIELTLEQLKELQKPASKPFKLPAVPILIIAGLLFLFQVNLTFFSGVAPQNPFEALLEQLPQISSEPDAAEQARLLEEKAAALAETAWYNSEQNFPNRSIKTNVWVEKKTPLHGSLEITTPEPALLTKEEIVNGVAPRPWLRRLEIKDLIFKPEGSVFLASGPALAYISIGEKNIRLAGQALLRAHLSEDQNKLTIEAVASGPLLGSLDLLNPATFERPILEFFMNQGESGHTQGFEFREKIELLRR